MERVQGIGGVFLRVNNREATAAWYQQRRGIDVDTTWWGHVFRWADQADAPRGSTTWGLFKPDTDYFGDRANQAMINFRVNDLDAMITQLRAGGCTVDDNVERSDYGPFGWVRDNEGRRMELWQPPEVDPPG